jgi:hypothetical protein
MEDRCCRLRSLERTGFVALALALGACGRTQRDGDTPKQEQAPATPRLLPWQLEAAGTSPLALGSFDRLLKAHCHFLPDEQGELRCLPVAPPALELKSEFADAGCTERVYDALHLDNVANVVGRPVTLPLPKSNCEQRYVVAKLRELASSEPRFSGIPGSCRQFTPQEPEPGAHDFVIAEVTSPAAWVSGGEVDGPLVAERLRLRQFAAPGEPSFPARLVDEQWNATCSLQQLSDRLVCVPPTLSADPPYFADQDCQVPLWGADACSQAVYIGSPGGLHALGESWQGPIFTLRKICEAVSESTETTSGRFLQQGEAVGLDALPATEWTTEGSGRLLLRGLKTGDGPFVALPDELFDYSSQRRSHFEVHAPRYRDEEAGEGCAPVWTRDAGVRCVAESTMVDPATYFMYADPDCTEPAYLCAGTCPKELVLMGYDENAEYRAVSRNRAIELRNMPLYTRDGDTCIAELGDPAFMKAGEALPWDGYAELQELNGRAAGAP